MPSVWSIQLSAGLPTPSPASSSIFVRGRPNRGDRVLLLDENPDTFVHAVEGLVLLRFKANESTEQISTDVNRICETVCSLTGAASAENAICHGLPSATPRQVFASIQAIRSRRRYRIARPT